jgi:hypothetical protein
MLALEELAVAGETSALMKRLFFEVGPPQSCVRRGIEQCTRKCHSSRAFGKRVSSRGLLADRYYSKGDDKHWPQRRLVTHDRRKQDLFVEYQPRLQQLIRTCVF